MTIQIKIVPPDKSAPGFFRRMKQGMELQEKAKGGDPASIDAMIEFLLPYVTEPTGRDEARAALWEASEDQISGALSAITTRTSEIPQS